MDYSPDALEDWLCTAFFEGKVSEEMLEFSLTDPYFLPTCPLSHQLPMWAASRGLPDGYVKCPRCRWVLRVTAAQVNEYMLAIARGYHVNCDTCGVWVIAVAFVEMSKREVKRKTV